MTDKISKELHTNDEKKEGDVEKYCDQIFYETAVFVCISVYINGTITRERNTFIRLLKKERENSLTNIGFFHLTIFFHKSSLISHPYLVGNIPDKDTRYLSSNNHCYN